jgi:predicted RNase H-like HicB family nuclease
LAAVTGPCSAGSPLRVPLASPAPAQAGQNPTGNVATKKIVRKILDSTVNFNVLLTGEDSWYIVKCVDNSVASQGRTMDEALVNLQKALELYYEDVAAS